MQPFQLAISRIATQAKARLLAKCDPVQHPELFRGEAPRPSPDPAPLVPSLLARLDKKVRTATDIAVEERAPKRPKEYIAVASGHSHACDFQQQRGGVRGDGLHPAALDPERRIAREEQRYGSESSPHDRQTEKASSRQGPDGFDLTKTNFTMANVIIIGQKKA
ncbi:hypothetical protein IE53DRAFT_370237 [Violaceomyces palustris]|uniref:Uncharacterized protein n=1 Tax=Violaceomyces palustris TaxID=1673888 RepID=A0ACD0NSZ2_9BASI|nr:hypothetical protein IE53DRAFT_370237 [Violaceomyces palustris]